MQDGAGLDELSSDSSLSDQLRTARYLEGSYRRLVARRRPRGLAITLSVPLGAMRLVPEAVKHATLRHSRACCAMHRGISYRGSLASDPACNSTCFHPAPCFSTSLYLPTRPMAELMTDASDPQAYLPQTFGQR
jgi:hypothetical protein